MAGSYADIINKKKREWNCSSLMNGARIDRSGKLPFSSPLLNYSTYGGIPRNMITEFFGDPGGGKAQPLDSHILTPGGWIEMRDAKVGQEVFDGQGNVCKIDGVYPQGMKNVYEIHFQDRTSIKVAEDHINVVWRHNSNTRSREDFRLTTSELIDMMNSEDYKRHSKLRVDLPTVEWQEQPVSIDPYLLGVLIGDGSLCGGNFDISSDEPDIMNKVQKILEEDWGCTLMHSDKNPLGYYIVNKVRWTPKTYMFNGKKFDSKDSFLDYLVYLGYPRIDHVTLYGCISGSATTTLKRYPELANIEIVSNPPSGRKQLLDALEDYGLLCKSIDKHIPSEYLYNSKDVRIRLLQGLYDTDGYTPKHDPDKGNLGSGSEFSTSSSRLSRDFSFLVRSLGIRDTVVRSKASYTHEGKKIQCNDSYNHYMKIPNDLEFFTSDKHKSRYKFRQNPPLRNIVDIEYVGEEECQCIHVDSEFHTYITDNFTPTHNTTTCIDICRNAHKIFVKEHEEKLDSLREKLVSGDKTVSVELDDLIERGPKKVLYVDLEHSFDSAWASKLGVDDGSIDIMQPPDVVAEELLQSIQELIETGELGLVVLDSIPSLTTKQELDKKYGERTVASLAGLLTIFCRKIIPILSRYETTLLVVNQVRDNMDNPYVVNTPGGKALKFYCALRILFRIGSPVDFLGNELPNNTDNPAGYIVNAKIVKQKSAPWDRRNGSYYLMAQSGIRIDMDIVQLAIKQFGLIRKSGAWYTLVDPETGEILENEGKPVKMNGLAKVLEYTQDNQEYYYKLYSYVESHLTDV